MTAYEPKETGQEMLGAFMSISDIWDRKTQIKAEKVSWKYGKAGDDSFDSPWCKIVRLLASSLDAT